MFNGPKPSAQPRTLRTIAEQKGTVPNGFIDGGVAPSGLPVGTPGAEQVYQDQMPAVTSAPPPPSPSPFGSIRRG